MIRAVIFDMDGLMYDTEPLVEKCWKKAVGHARIPLTAQTLAELRTRNSADRESYLKSIFGDHIDYKRLERQMYRELHTLIGTRGLPIKPGLWELLVWLRRNGYRLAVQTTNSSEVAAWYLEISGCAEYFDVTVSGKAVVSSKPEPEIYTKTVHKLDLRPEECLVLEDSSAGIIGAHRAGCPSIMIPDMDPPTSGARALAKKIMPSLRDVIDYIRNGNNLPERPWQAVRNIVFDFGGVLLDYNPRAYLRDRFADKNVEDVLYNDIFGSETWLKSDAGLISRKEANDIYLSQAKKAGYLFEAQTVLDEWQDLLRTKQDSVALLQRLKKRGYRLYFLSNISEDTFAEVSKRDFMKLFDGGVTSFETHILKPGVEIYQQLLANYRLRPEETIFFDDTQENVDVANELGIIGRRFHSALLAAKNLEGYQVL